jgi:hypothetical protein
MKASTGLVVAAWIATSFGCGSATPPAAAPSEPAPASGATSAGASSGGNSSAPAAPTPGSASLPAPVKMTRAIETRFIGMSFDLQLTDKGASAGVQSGSWSIKEERTMIALGVQADSIAKLEVTYGRREAKPLLGIEERSVTQGKSYILMPGDASPDIKTAQGASVSDAEQNALDFEYGYVGGPSPLRLLVASGKPRSTLQPGVAARRALIGDAPGIDESQAQVTATFKGIATTARKVAQLDCTVKAELTSGDMTFDLDLKGPAEIDLATGWVASLDLEGTVHAHGKEKIKKQMLDAAGHGTAKITRHAVFQ